MFTARRASRALPRRFYSTSSPVKPSVKLIAELRKMTEGVSLTKAREALAASNNDLAAALEWLDADRAATGAARVAKLADRVAGEGLIGVQVLSKGFPGGVRAAMVELNCETDFVARNELFGRLLANIAHTAAFLAEPKGAEGSGEGEGPFIHSVSLDMLNDAPLLDHSSPQTSMGGAQQRSVESAVRDLVTKVGEKITLRRAATVARDPFPASQRHLGMRVFPYLHGSSGTIPSVGTKGALALYALKSPRLSELSGSDKFQSDLASLERSLGRTIVGFPTTHVGDPLEASQDALYHMPTDMFPNKERGTVVEELSQWVARHRMAPEEQPDDAGIALLEFKKWSVGETMESS